MLDQVEQKICEIIDRHAQQIIDFGDDIWRHAEVGFKEYRTSQKLAEGLEALGLKPQTGIGITGVKAYLKDPAATEGYNVCLMGEMDALPMPNHPAAWSETGAAHACGHNAQMTGVYGAAIALSDPEIRDLVNGNITFIGVPSEEFSADTAAKIKLIHEGKIGCGSGKGEMIRLGALDDVDITVCHHIWDTPYAIVLNDSGNGNVHKLVKFTGKAAHGTAAHKGIDAFEAAHVAITAVNSNRETFPEKDFTRIHCSLTESSKASNVISDVVELDFSVRAKTMAGVKRASYKVDRSLKAGAMAVGAGVEIETVAGMLPYIPSRNTKLLKSVLDDLANGRTVEVLDSAADPSIHSCGSTDLGELTHLMPVVQFGTAGAEGDGHTVDYKVVDPYLYYVETAKIFALCGYRLLKDGAAAAKDLLDGFKPVLDAEGYRQYLKDFQKIETIPVTPAPTYE